MDLKQYQTLAHQKHKDHRKFLDGLRKKPPKNLDYIAEKAHHEVFAEIDCLQCANCCKTTGPLFTEKDIERIAKHLRLKPAEFEARYLRTDEDNDKVLQSLPCHFLASDNKCLIYDVRPKACREYPHTDRRKIYQINALMLKNTLICPAAYTWVEKMRAKVDHL